MRRFMSGPNWSHASRVIALASMLLAGAPTIVRAKENTRTHEYLIVVTHDAADCLRLLDDWARDHKRLLAKAKWGCSEGVHTGWVVVEATSEQAAMAMIPASSREYARAVMVETMDKPDRLQRVHRMLEQMYSLQKSE